MGQIVVVASGKGGTGKTTICAGVASALAHMGQTVLAIDADVGLRNLDIALGMADLATVAFTEVTEGRQPLERIPRHPRSEALALLTAPTTVEQVDDAAFADLLRDAAAHFDWVFVDAPAGVGEGVRLAARHADRALVVATGDTASLRDAGRAAELLAELGLTRVQLVVNRVARRLLQRMHTTVDDAMDSVGLPLLGIVPEDTHVPLSAARNLLLIDSSERGAAAACRNIARRLMEQRVPLMRMR